MIHPRDYGGGVGIGSRSILNRRFLSRMHGHTTVGVWKPVSQLPLLQQLPLVLILVKEVRWENGRLSQPPSP